MKCIAVISMKMADREHAKEIMENEQVEKGQKLAVRLCYKAVTCQKCLYYAIITEKRDDTPWFDSLFHSIW